ITSRRWPGSTTSPGRASTSSTRPVTGAWTRASASSLNCALPLVSSEVARSCSFGAATTTETLARAGAAAGSALAVAPAVWGPRYGPPRPPTLGRAPAEPWRASGLTQDVSSGLPWSADGGFELVERAPVGAERAEVLERGLAIRALRVEEVEQAQAAAPVRELHGVARALGLGQVRVAQQEHLVALVGHLAQRDVHVGEHLNGRRLAQGVGAVDLRARARDLALVAVEDAQRDADPHAERVIGADPLVGGLRRDVPPRVGARQLTVGAGAGPRGLRRLQIRPGVERAAAQHGDIERHVAEAELAAHREVRRHCLGPHRGAQRDARGRDGLAGVGGVALEGEALDLDARQLELGDVALLGADALQPLHLVEGLQIVAGQDQRRLGNERVGERLLDLRDDLPLHVFELGRGHADRRASAVEPASALAAELDGLADGDRV